MFRKHVSLAIAMFCTFFANGQEQIGLRLDNYSGINSVGINPAGPGASTLSWDVNLFGFAQFFDNNYSYITNSTVLVPFNLHPTKNDVIFAPDINPETNFDEISMIIDFYNDGKKRYLYNHTALLGPSFFVKINENHSLGLVTGARLLGSARDVTDNYSYYIYYNRPFFEEFEVDPFRAGFVSFSELGLNYSYTRPTAGGSMSIGVTARYLKGFEAAYLRNASTFTMEKLARDTVMGSPIDFRYAYTRSNLTTDDFAPTSNGSGFSLDIGAIFTLGAYESGYKWKIGFSLLDLGRVKFTQNSRRHRVLTDNSRILDYNPFLRLDAVENFETTVIGSFSEQMLGDAGASLEGESFSTWLPSAASAQIDYFLTANLYLNALLVQGFPLGDGAIGRGNLLAFTPRFDSKWIGASLPVTLYNYQRLRVGFSLRLAFVTIGTEYLDSYVGRSDISGSDLYFAIKIFSLNSVRKGSGAQGFRKIRGGKNDAKCYQF